VALRYDYAVFSHDEYVGNSMLTRAEAKRMESEGFRCIDVAASVDATLPRFRVRRYVGFRGQRNRRWG
jgi:hypothetical protein